VLVKRLFVLVGEASTDSIVDETSSADYNETPKTYEIVLVAADTCNNP